MYSIGEHATLSKPVTVNMSEIFANAGLKMTSATAWSLTGNQKIEDMDAKKFNWDLVDVTGGKVEAEISANGKLYETRFPFDPNNKNFAVTLRPMEVRIFIALLSKLQMLNKHFRLSLVAQEKVTSRISR